MNITALEVIHFLEAFIAAIIRMSIPLTLAGLGEAYSERSGILNIGLEGIMLFGSFASFITAYLSGSIFLGVLAGALTGIAASLLHGFISIQCKADQTIGGLALNFLAMGITSYLFLLFFGRTTNLPVSPVAPALNLPFLFFRKIPYPVSFGGTFYTK